MSKVFCHEATKLAIWSHGSDSGLWRPTLVFLGKSTLGNSETKAEVKAEVARLVDAGVEPEEIVVYGRENVTVELRSVVRF